MILQHYFFTNLVRTFVFSSLMIAFIVSLTDLFIVLLPKLDNGISIVNIFLASYYNLLNSLIKSLQFALLFSNAYVVGMFSSNRELLACNSLGISLMRLARPSIYIGMVCSILASVSSDEINILSKKRNTLLSIEKKNNATDLPFEYFWKTGYFYSTYYNTTQKKYLDITIIETNNERAFTKRIDAEHGTISNGFLTLYNVRIFNFSQKALFYPSLVYTNTVINPVTINAEVTNLEDYTKKEIRDYILKLKERKKATYKTEITLYERYIEPFMNLVISCFPLFFIQTRKNALLFSIVQATALAVILFCMQIIFSIMGNAGTINPLLTNLLPLIVTLIIIFIIDKSIYTYKYGLLRFKNSIYKASASYQITKKELKVIKKAKKLAKKEMKLEKKSAKALKKELKAELKKEKKLAKLNKTPKPPKPPKLSKLANQNSLSFESDYADKLANVSPIVRVAIQNRNSKDKTMPNKKPIKPVKEKKQKPVKQKDDIKPKERNNKKDNTDFLFDL